MARLVFLTTIVALTLTVAACGKRTAVVAPSPAPPSEDSLYAQGLAAFREGTPEGYIRSIDAFQNALKLRPDRCEYALNLAQSLLFLAAEQVLNWEEFEPRQTAAAAIVESKQATCMASNESFILRLRALIAGRGRTSDELINRAVDLDPSDAMNWVVLGYLDPTSARLTTLQGTGKWVAMAQAAVLDPNSALIQYEAAKNYQVMQGKEAEARQGFARAIELSPRHYRAILGSIYSADDNFDVEPLYQKVVELAPRFLEGRIAAGSYYGSLEETEKAVEQYSAALAINPKYDIAEFRLGLLMMQANRAAEAERHFQAVVDLNPGSFEAHYYLGNLLYGRNYWDGAKSDYDQAVKIRVNYAEAEYGIGWVYRQKDQIDLALAQFNKVIQMQPRYGDAYLSRGDIHAERREFSQAIADYEKAIQVYEDQIKGFNATIAFTETRSQSRLMQAEKKRAERDKARIETLIQRARQNKSEIEDSLKK